jgi:alkyl hydroperoxide reductase subunit D
MRSIYSEANSGIHRDLKLNLQQLLESQNLGTATAHLALLALATANRNEELQQKAAEVLKQNDVPAAQIREASELAGLMGMLNIYYRFRHMIKDAQGEAAGEKYKRTGLRMNSMSKPDMPHQVYEMISFALSIHNGCEMCITAHEKKSMELGASEEQLHDLARLAAVVKGVTDFGFSGPYGEI